jgi:endonuclease/exonuclease/phosphatase family metal-dependent hydrolase
VGAVPSPIPGGPDIVVKRGFVGVDVRADGKTYRVVNTHLEIRQPSPDPASAIIQSLQAVELAGTLAVTTPAGRTLILLGDFNSSPEDPGPITPPYQVLAGSGFEDAWLDNLWAFLNPDGFTCCQDADLANAASHLSERIDLVWVRSARSFQSALLVTGRVPLLFSPAPHWASDHAGVFGALTFPR